MLCLTIAILGVTVAVWAFYGLVFQRLSPLEQFLFFFPFTHFDHSTASPNGIEVEALTIQVKSRALEVQVYPSGIYSILLRYNLHNEPVNTEICHAVPLKDAVKPFKRILKRLKEQTL